MENLLRPTIMQKRLFCLVHGDIFILRKQSTFSSIYFPFRGQETAINVLPWL